MNPARSKIMTGLGRRRGAGRAMAAAFLAPLSLLLLTPQGFRPDEALAFAPADEVRPLAVEHPGRPALAAGPAGEKILAAAPEWQRFRAGSGRDWMASFNPTSGAPHRAWGSGLTAGAGGPVLSEADALDRARAFVAQHAALLACQPEELAPMRVVRRAGRTIIVFQQTHQGIPVEGGRVDVRLSADGKVTLFGSDFFPGVNISVAPSFSADEAVARVGAEVGFDAATDQQRGVELRILPIARDVPGRMPEYRLVYRVAQYLPRTPALWVTYVDAQNGGTLWRYDDLKYESVSGTVEADVQLTLPDDPYVTRALDHLKVTVTGQDSDVTDVTGAFSIPVPGPGSYEVTAQLRGIYLDVNNSAGADASFSGTYPSGTPLTIHWDDTNSQADERDAYFHATIAHDSLKAMDPGMTSGDYVMPCEVSIASTCNAYWDGVGINFYAAGGGCVNTGQIPDVVYHEYAHGISQWTFSPGSPAGDEGEGFSDYYGATLTDQPVIGRGFRGPGTSLRTLDNDLVYPDDLTGEVHHDGLIIGGALWHMRERFINTLRDHTAAVHLADSLFHYACYGMSTAYPDYFLDLVMEDDDDGDLGNGTPHGIDIYQAFGRHGIGPGLYLAVEHDSLKDTELAGTPVTVEATITSVLPLRTDSLRVTYRTRPVAGGAPWSAYADMPLVLTGTPHVYRAEIPGQPDSTVVQYYVVAQSDTLELTTMVPAAGAADPYVFLVGPDRVPPMVFTTPLPNQAVSEWPPTVVATATDNYALASVVLDYRRNGAPQPAIPMTPTGVPDQWQATFPPGAMAGDEYEYRIIATDASLAANVTIFPAVDYYSVFVGALLTLFNDTVESGSPGWTHYVVTPDYHDQWHISTNRNHTPGGSHSWKCGATGIFGKYSNFDDAALQSPPVLLGDHSQLRFWHWMRAEAQDATSAWDGGILEITTDGGSTWHQLTPRSGGYTHVILANPDSPFEPGTPCWSGSFDWRESVVDLTAYHGTVSLRFRFGTDGATTDFGWHVDDIQMTAVDSRTDIAAGWGDAIPATYELAANQPNPFNPETTIRFALPRESRVHLAVYDVNGRLVRSLVAGVLPAGHHTARWDGSSDGGERVASGIYFARMEAGTYAATRKMTLLK